MRFFFNDTATTEIYTLSLHDALPILVDLLLLILTPSPVQVPVLPSKLIQLELFDLGALLVVTTLQFVPSTPFTIALADRKSTRLNSSHANISYAVFCLKKKNNIYLTY